MPSCSGSFLSCIRPGPALHPSRPLFLQSCILSVLPTSLQCGLPPVLPPSYPASLLSCLYHSLPPFYPACPPPILPPSYPRLPPILIPFCCCLPSSNVAFLRFYLPLFLLLSFPASLPFRLLPILPSSYPASFLSFLPPILPPSYPASLLSGLLPILPPSCPLSIDFSITFYREVSFKNF